MTIENTAGDLTGVSQNGGVDLQGINGYVTARTANGSIDIADCAGVDGAESSNGSVDVEIPRIRDETTIRTGNGSIDAELGSELDADLTASTSIGSIDVEDLSLADSSVSNRRVTGRLGDGGTSLKIRTSNGSIDLTALV
ncbi:hypothetical protein DM2_2260 [Halorubrum sp. DM2]|uniref:DUF4097 family beta strand repeat-containing protein n=1 Tax=Halorubrum sp. DM2 TaxID=2527867 RepID=UPI0024B76942|nr:DUF4097 family beta strand repeat-containing protein [Halorubrum sp. DM2]VTT86222.1 hypothetical protein DM2_2260 [Halorubrum sp. DM2]